MAKKLTDIAKLVENSASTFVDFLKENLTQETFEIIENISEKTDVYIFSGVIRNFFLKTKEIRDIDLIITDEIDIETIFVDFEIKQNSFGGYKIIRNTSTIDLWYLKTTWALQYQPILNFDIEKYIPSTAFFNFSSIIFDFNKRKFYATSHFLKFLRDKQIDVVYKPSANYRLCIINSFYYSDKYNLRISENLKKHILILSKTVERDFETPQIKHFGKVLYSTEDLLQRISKFKKDMEVT